MKKYSNHRYSGSPGGCRMRLGAKGSALSAEMNLQIPDDLVLGIQQRGPATPGEDPARPASSTANVKSLGWVSFPPLRVSVPANGEVADSSRNRGRDRQGVAGRRDHGDLVDGGCDGGIVDGGSEEVDDAEVGERLCLAVLRRILGDDLSGSEWGGGRGLLGYLGPVLGHVEERQHKASPAQGGDRGRHGVARFHGILEEHRSVRGYLEPSRIQPGAASAVALSPDLLSGAGAVTVEADRVAGPAPPPRTGHRRHNPVRGHAGEGAGRASRGIACPGRAGRLSDPGRGCGGGRGSGYGGRRRGRRGRRRGGCRRGRG